MSQNQIRIIGGHWRGRLITVPEAKDLRPTADRIRETLFNWLQPVVIDAVCADFFAGTGILGIEALSRGAKSCAFSDNNKTVRAQLSHSLSMLNIKCEPIQSTYLDILNSNQKFNLIFLDPPYKEKIIPALLEKIIDKSLLHENGFIFVEHNEPLDFELPKGLTWHRQKKAGQVYFGLLSNVSEDPASSET